MKAIIIQDTLMVLDKVRSVEIVPNYSKKKEYTLHFIFNNEDSDIITGLTEEEAQTELSRILEKMEEQKI